MDIKSQLISTYFALYEKKKKYYVDIVSRQCQLLVLTILSVTYIHFYIISNEG